MTVYQINTLPPNEVRQAMDHARELKQDHFHFRHCLKSGEVRDVEVYTSPCPWEGKPALFSIVHDVTEARRLQNRALQQERLSAVGEMTASLYHEFGNLLGVLFSQIQLMELEIPEGSAKERLEAKIHSQFSRAQRLVESVKSFSKDQGIEMQECRLGPLLEELIDLEGPLCRKAGVSIAYVGSQEDRVRVDTALVQQVFLNLFKNAVQALTGTAGPRITIEVRTEAHDVVVRFGNNGPEIVPEVRTKLFTPFFTTKNGVAGEGTGLGLSFSWNIIHHHGGSIFLEEGPGTVFQLRLPRN